MQEIINTQSQVNVLSSIFNNISEGLIIVNQSNEILHINKSCENITGYTKGEVVGKNPIIFCADNLNKTAFEKILITLKINDFWIGELDNRHKNGSTYPIIIKIHKFIDYNTNELFYYAIFSDISAKSDNQENELYHLAYHDSLTNLPNRLKLKAQMEYLISNAKRNELKFAVLFLDLDNFKEVNDKFGHAKGDELLIELATKFKNSVRSNDMVARVGGDEFIIVLSDINDFLFIERVCNKILNIIEVPIKDEFHSVKIGVSIGVALFPENGEDIDELIHNADSAMYQVKHNGKNSFELFSKEMNQKLVAHTQLERDLENAIKYDEFVLHYHPEVEINTKEVFSLEILTRWNHFSEGLKYPGSFIPDLEVSNLIYSFEELILQKACTQLKLWHDQKFYTGSISVNISTKHLEYGNLCNVVERVLKLTNLEAKYLELEFDEKAIMNISVNALKKLEQLSKQGVVISIDNFGKGFASYTYLRECFITRLKIDKSYIDSLMDNNSDEDIVKSIIDLGSNMGISVIAEGIEMPIQDEILKKNSCTRVQGYYYAIPMDSIKFENWYKKLTAK